MEEGLRQTLQVVKNEYTTAEKVQQEKQVAVVMMRQQGQEQQAAAKIDHQEIEASHQEPIEQPQMNQSVPSYVTLSTKLTAKTSTTTRIRSHNNQANIKPMSNVRGQTTKQE